LKGKKTKLSALTINSCHSSIYGRIRLKENHTGITTSLRESLIKIKEQKLNLKIQCKSPFLKKFSIFSGILHALVEIRD